MSSFNPFEGLIDPKINDILLCFIRNRNELFHLRKVSDLVKVPLSSTFRIVNRLVSLKIVKIVRVNKFKLYQLDDNEKTKALSSTLAKNEKN